MTVYLRAALLALVINGLLLLAAAQLVRERAEPQDMTAPTTVSLVTVPPEEIPPDEAEPEPVPPPRREPSVDFAPDLPTPSLTAPVLSGPAVVLDAGLRGGAGPMGEMIFEAEDLDQAPQAVVHTAPQYPYRARQRRIEGEVQVRFLVNVDGATSRISILESRPTGVFDQVVVDAVARWRFRPGQLAGRAVAAWVVAPVAFDLSGGG